MSKDLLAVAEGHGSEQYWVRFCGLSQLRLLLQLSSSSVAGSAPCPDGQLSTNVRSYPAAHHISGRSAPKCADFFHLIGNLGQLVQSAVQEAVQPAVPTGSGRPLASHLWHSGLARAQSRSIGEVACSRCAACRADGTNSAPHLTAEVCLSSRSDMFLFFSDFFSIVVGWVANHSFNF